MKEQIASVVGKPRLLLHCCCAPCTAGVIDRLIEHFDISFYYYNPNIYPLAEYQLRLDTLTDFTNAYNKDKGCNIQLISCVYDSEPYTALCSSLSHQKEGQERCYRCYALRLYQTALIAKRDKYEFFCTTLSVSPHKNSQAINRTGLLVARDVGVNFLVADFAKQDGYGTSIRMSNQYSLYRQNYCGCQYSMPNNESTLPFFP